LSRLKIEYLKCEFNGVKGGGQQVTVGRVVIPWAKKFTYLGSNIEAESDVKEKN